MRPFGVAVSWARAAARLRHGQAQREPGAPRHRLGDVDADDALDLQVGREPVHGVVDLVPHDREARLVILELVPQLAGGVERVVLDDDRPEPQHRVERDHVLRTVREHDRDPVAVRDAEAPQALGRAVDLLAQVAVGRRGAEELERFRAGVAGDARVDHVRQGLSDLVDRIGDFGRVRGEPGAVGVRVLRIHPPSLAQRTRARVRCARPKRVGLAL